MRNIYQINGNLALNNNPLWRAINNITIKTEDEEPAKAPNPRKGKSCEVYPFEVDEIKKMLDKFAEKGAWTQYLLFTIGINMARRCGDTLKLKWRHIFDPANGNFRSDLLPLKEEKTDKFASPHINVAVRNAVNLYIEKTGCNPAKDNYNEYVFLQLSGTHKGSVLSESGYLKCLKQTAKEIGITKNIGTHSTRKTFGKITKMIHPSDYDSMEMLQEIFNHADTKVTNRYIGLTKEKVDQYYDDMGQFFSDYVTGNKEYKEVAEKPIINLDVNDLRDIIKIAYESGMNNADEQNAIVHIDAINKIMGMVEDLQV